MKISFEELAIKQKEILSKVRPVTLEQAKEKIEKLKRNSKCKLHDKKRSR